MRLLAACELAAPAGAARINPGRAFLVEPRRSRAGPPGEPRLFARLLWFHHVVERAAQQSACINHRSRSGNCVLASISQSVDHVEPSPHDCSGLVGGTVYRGTVSELTLIIERVSGMGRPLAGKVALVAGATREVGRGIAVAPGEASATVYVTGRSTRFKRSEIESSGRIEETAELVEKAGGRDIAVEADHLVAGAASSLVESAATLNRCATTRWRQKDGLMLYLLWN